MEIGIGIKVDPGDAAAKAQSVADALGRAENAAFAAQRATTGLSGAFKSLAQAIQQHQSALERTGQSHRFLTSSSAAAAGAFGKMAEAMRREQEVLERIHGPARRYAEDLQVLDSLLARNVIRWLT
jgi:hypothetical protein